MRMFKAWFAGLSDQWRATIRTAWQSFVGGLLVIILMLINSASDWISGDEVDFIQELSNAGRGVALLMLTTLTGLVTYFMNRGDRGASYVIDTPT
jgi:hypothetical protein